MKKQNQKTKANLFTPAEQRAARAERIGVEEAEPYGWMAYSEAKNEQAYHLFCDPETKRLVCTCADFIFRGDLEHRYECKHVGAVLKHIARVYLEKEYEPRSQFKQAA